MITCDRTRPLHYATEDGWEGHGITQLLHLIAPAWGDEAAMARGSAVHAAYACRLLGLDVEVPPAFVGREADWHGYITAIEAFVADQVNQVLQVEEPSRHTRLHYATRIDSLVTLRSAKGDALTLVELKSGGPSWLHRVQVLAQAKLDGMERGVRLAVLYVRPDGTYHVERVPWDAGLWGLFESTAIFAWNRYTYTKGGTYGH